MELPSGVFRQQQRWTPKMNLEGDGRLVAYNNYEHSYNNLCFSMNAMDVSSSNLNSIHSSNYSNQTKPKQVNNNYGNNTHLHNQPQQQHKKPRGQQKRINLVSIKSKIGVEYRRYAVLRDNIVKFDEFFKKVASIHQLQGTSFMIYYSDQDGELLPINNDDNLAKAVNSTARLKSTHHTDRPFLKLFLEKKGIPNELYYLSKDLTFKCKRKDNFINLLMPSSANSSDSRPRISMLEDFRQVSSIIDVDNLPPYQRRVVLKQGRSDKPLGFYIRDGALMNSQGVIEKNYAIFISRVVPGGLAESTNLLAENDEILEVNGIDVRKNKTLDQVRDMMIANSSNLIITTRPAKPINNRLRTNRNMTSYIGRDRLPSSQSTSSDLGEDFVRHHMN